MASSLSDIVGKDGASATIAGGILAIDKSGAGTGPFIPAHAIVDTQGVNTATIKAASTAVVAGDTAIAIGLHPTSPLPAGTNVIGHVIVDTLPSGAVTNAGTFAVQVTSAPTTAITAASLPLPAGAATAALQPTAAAQGSTTSGQTGNLIQGAVTTAAPTYTTAQTSPLSLDTSGNLRVLVTNPTGEGQQVMASSAPVALASDQKYQTGMSPKGFAHAFTTLTRPANTTAYTAGNSISNNVTAASVTALTATVSDTNGDPVTLVDILLSTTDTGAAGKRIRAYVYNSDPTASSGVGAGDGAAFANKHAGYIGSFSGLLETGFSDGAVGRLVPSFNDGATSPTPNAPAGGLVVTLPVSGAETLFIQFQAVDGFTPVSASTWIATARGFQGRAN